MTPRARTPRRRSCASIENQPDVQIVIDLVLKEVTCGSLTVPVDIPEAARQSLIEGFWDTTAQLPANQQKVHSTAAAIPYMNWSIEL